jgi:hypothetical protein
LGLGSVTSGSSGVRGTVLAAVAGGVLDGVTIDGVVLFSGGGFDSGFFAGTLTAGGGALTAPFDSGFFGFDSVPFAGTLTAPFDSGFFAGSLRAGALVPVPSL